MGAFLSASETGLVPIFPLPDASLLPGEALPLYIFEPRYRQMIKDVLLSDGLVAIARFQPGWQEEYHGNPPIYPCMGVGRLVAHRFRPDDTSDILLKGIARVRLISVAREMPYRLGRFDDLPEVVSDEARLAQLVAETRHLLKGIAPLVDPEHDAVSFLVDELDQAPGRIASLLPIAPVDRQAMIEADDRVERFERLVRVLRDSMSRRDDSAPRDRRGDHPN